MATAGYPAEGNPWNDQVNCYGACDGSVSSKRNSNGFCNGDTQFPAPSEYTGFGKYLWEWSIMDKVIIPDNLEAGNYLLSWCGPCHLLLHAAGLPFRLRTRVGAAGCAAGGAAEPAGGTALTCRCCFWCGAGGGIAKSPRKCGRTVPTSSSQAAARKRLPRPRNWRSVSRTSCTHPARHATPCGCQLIHQSRTS